MPRWFGGYCHRLRTDEPGLRPPQPGSVPGTAKAPEALREAGLFTALAAAVDRGCVIPGRYVDDYVPGSGRVCNQDEIVRHAVCLADFGCHRRSA